MPGTPEGGNRTKAKIEAKYGKGYWAEIGRKGGKATAANGRNVFVEDREYAVEMGKKAWEMNKRYEQSQARTKS